MVNPRLLCSTLSATGSGFRFVLDPEFLKGCYPGPGELDSGFPSGDYLVSRFPWDW